MEDQNKPKYIPRKLNLLKKDSHSPKTIHETEILHSFTQPLIVLGGAGIGKSELMKVLGTQPGCKFITATSFLRQSSHFTNAKDCLVIDGLDEVATVKDGDPLHHVLEKLVQYQTPRFIISCRSEEWDAVSGKLAILEEYSAAPTVLYLESLEKSDAIGYLCHDFDRPTAERVIQQLDEYKLPDFYQYPLNLNLIREIIFTEGDIPRDRASLYERAINELRKEKNPKHKSKSTLTQLSEKDALDAAGAVMAAMLITGNDAATITVENGALKVSELSDIANIDHIKTILKSRLFRTDPTRPDCFNYLHRSIAEFLGARWLARKVETTDYQNRTVKRLIGIITSAGGIPSSLRGLHAWLPKFSPTRLGPDAIEKNPYGILLYGDGDGLNEQQARQMLQSLRNLANFDPEFRTEWWKKISFKGLAHPALTEEIKEIIEDQSAPLGFKSLVFESIEGSVIAQRLEINLKNLVLDKTQYFHERRMAAQVLSSYQECSIDWQVFFYQLLKNKDVDSLRIGLKLLSDIGFNKITTDLLVQFIVTCSGFTSIGADDDRALDGALSYVKELPLELIDTTLDKIVEAIHPIFAGANIRPSPTLRQRQKLSMIMSRLIARRLKHGGHTVSANTLWRWLQYIDNETYFIHDDSNTIADLFKSDSHLRQDIQRIVLFDTTQNESFRNRLFRLACVCHELDLSNDDAKVFLREVSQRNNYSERALWKELVNFFRENGFIPKNIQEIALPYAKNNQELTEFLTKGTKQSEARGYSVVTDPEDQSKPKGISVRIQKVRENYSVNISAVKRGDRNWIVDPAKVYLDMFSDLDSNRGPHERVSNWIGNELAEAVLEGFEATLHRTDLPTVNQVSKSYDNVQQYHFVYPMLAGAAERIRTGKGFANLPYNLLSAISIAAESALLSPRETLPDLKAELEQLLRQDPHSYEIHLRKKFEPQLQANKTNIHGLYEFTSSKLNKPISTQLSLEWLEKFTDLAREIEAKLMFCMLQGGHPDDNQIQVKLVEIARKRIENLQPDTDRQLYWLSFLFLADFDAICDQLPDVTEDRRAWLWHLIAFVPSLHHQRNPRISMSIKQLKWIVTHFRPLWSYTRMPTSCVGSQHPWDATKQLTQIIQLIASEPSEEAAQALSDLQTMPIDGYTEIIQTAIATQHRLYVEACFSPPTLDQFKATLSNNPAQSAADIQAIMVDEIENLQIKLRGDPFNIVNNFYNDNGTPKTENECRDQLFIALGNLPFNIQAPPEMAMPQGNRSDAAFVYHDIAVPFEAKGQWHPHVWQAAEMQLDNLYCGDYRANQKGIYLVFWFGPDVTNNKKPKSPPNDTPKPNTGEEMRASIIKLIPLDRLDDIAVIVLDLTRTQDAKYRKIEKQLVREDFHL